MKALLDRVQTHYSKDDLLGKEEEQAQIMRDDDLRGKEEEQAQLMCDLRDNGYKDKFIAKWGTREQHVKKTNQGDVNRISVLYIRGVSEPIKVECAGQKFL